MKEVLPGLWGSVVEPGGSWLHYIVSADATDVYTLKWLISCDVNFISFFKRDP